MKARVAFFWPRMTQDYKQVFRNVQGERVLGNILDQCGMGTSPTRYDGQGRLDPHETAVAVGRQQVGQFIMDQLNFTEQDLRVLQDDLSGQGAME